MEVSINMNYPVIKGVSYALAHAPDMAVYQGSTQTVERKKNPASEYLAKMPGHLRNFQDVVQYPPNQVYIGNILPEELSKIARPWYENSISNAATDGKYGEIVPQDVFIGLIKVVDAFELVYLEKDFQAAVKAKIMAHPIFGDIKDNVKLDKNPAEIAEIEKLINDHNAEGFYHEGRLVGCVRKAHDTDQALTSHVMFENLVSKASAVIALKLLFAKTSLEPADIDYIIETSEEACGDMNQRGGGNFAKAIGEICDCVNATGSDTRGFCAAPAHGIIEAAGLVQSGIFKNVVVLAGGSVAKLGMNGKDHVAKGLPILEDVVGAFAVHISENDGINPAIRTDAVGRHKIGSGASPQALNQAIVFDPIENMGWTLADFDKFSVEMHNPEITEPAGAGDVPKANYKMIAALGVKKGEFAREDIDSQVERFGMSGFAPTQGHIPSGVPFIGFARDLILDGSINRVMVIGKGSLFLGRMTNLFDGVSFVIEKNLGIKETKAVTGSTEAKIRVGITILGSELGKEELLAGAEKAQKENPGLEVVVIGSGVQTNLEVVQAEDEKESHEKMDKMLTSGELNAAVTMHYSFPIGVSTVGRVITPGKGKEMYIATTTGTSATERVSAMVKNAVYGLAAARACGNPNPTIGILNVDGARHVERVLKQLKDKGFPVEFTESARGDGGVVMRGNDLLLGVPDVMVTDSLTGNVLMKMFSAFSTGGNYEAVGYGYGPGIGERYNKIICILSRASGIPVVANAIKYAGELAKGNLIKETGNLLSEANRAGLSELLAATENTSSVSRESNTSQEIKPPPAKVVTEEIPGIEILELDDAAHLLWKNNIYAATGMGCTGPIIQVAGEDKEKAVQLLKEAKFI